MIDNVELGLIKFFSQIALCHGHPYRVAEALPQGARGCFNPRSMAYLRVTRGFRV